MKFLILNGPNLNLLGRREPGVYGAESYESLCRRLKDFAAAPDSTADCFPSNHEGPSSTPSTPPTGWMTPWCSTPAPSPTTPTPCWTR